MTFISKDTDSDQVSCLQSSTILMLAAPIIMILALFSLYFHRIFPDWHIV